MKRYKSKMAKKETMVRDWYLVDASGKTLGRLATKLATYLRGKHKALYTPHVDCGDFMVVVNAEKIKVTGKKLEQKIYFTHSGYPGGARMVTLEKMQAAKPTKVLEMAVAGMLPKNRLGRQMLKKLRVYSGDKHPHQAKLMKKLEG